MRNDSFHYTSSPTDLGPGVSPSKLEHATPITARETVSGSYKYSGEIPEPGHTDLYFYTYADLEILMEKPVDEIRDLARVHRWRSRMHQTTKVRSWYLMDLLATTWSYMTRFYGHKINEELLAEATQRYRD